MASLTLTDSHSRAEFFHQAILKNVHYWRAWLEANMTNVAALDRERNGIVKAISFGLNLEAAWPPVFELITTLSPLMERRGHWEMWAWVLSRSLETARQVKDVAAEVTLLALLARLSFQQSRFKEATTHYRRSLRLARQMRDRFNEARACTNLGFYYIEQGQWRRAEVLCCYALELFEQLDNAHGRAHTENHLGLLYTRQHYWTQAQYHLERACEIWQIMEDQHGLMRGFINLGGLHIKMEQPDEALRYLEKALELAKSSGDEPVIGRIYLNIGQANISGGDLVKAETYVLQAEAIFQQFSNPAELARTWGNLGTIYSHQGKWQQAILHLEKSLQGWRSLKSKVDEIVTLMDIIEHELARENQHQALIRLKEIEQLIGPDQENGPYRHLQPRLVKYRRSLTEHIP